MISEYYIAYYKEIIEINIEKLDQTNQTLSRTSKTPQKVTNIRDYYFGQFLGGIKYSCAIDYLLKEKKSLTPDEWMQLDELFIDYQDALGKAFYK